MRPLFQQVRTGILSSRVRLTRTTGFVETLSRETNDPLWRILLALRQPDFAAKVFVPDYHRWGSFTRSKGLAATLQEMKGKPGPLWLAMYLLVFETRVYNDVYPAGFDLAYAHLPGAPKHHHGPMLIFMIASLARYNLLFPMQKVIDTFLTADHTPHWELYFNLFIQALTMTPTRSPEAAKAIVELIKRMEARKLSLSQETYDLLLRDNLVNIHLAHFLRSHMARQSAVPTVSQLESYLRIFAKQGLVKEATGIHSAIKERLEPSTKNQSEDAPLFNTRHNQPEMILNRADKDLLRSDANMVTEYLYKLVNPHYHANPKPFDLKHLEGPRLTALSSIPKPDVYTLTSMLASKASDRSMTGEDLVTLFEKLRLRHDVEPNEVTYTVLLQGLYERKKWDLAVHYWNQFYRSGLPMDRKALGIGVQLFTRFNRPNSAFGLLYQWAFRPNLSERESEAVKSDDGVASESKTATNLTAGEGTKIAPRVYRPVSLSVITLNDWVVALIRIARPDAVLALWDAFRPLFNVYPDARVLSNVLIATRCACRLDGTSLQGVVVRMKYEVRETFGVNYPASPKEEITADDARRNLEAVLGSPTAPTPKPYTSSLWHGRLPADHARLLFLQAMFGAAPDPKALMDVEPPARATRKRAPSEEGEEVWGGLNVGFPKWREEGVDTWEPPEWEELLMKRKSVVSSPKESEEIDPIWLEEEDDEVAVEVDDTVAAVIKGVDELINESEEWQWDSYHPSITPTDDTFFHYILLLGLTGRASEIARVLAWMRHLKITPRRSTLGASLVFWGEVSGRAILVERWTRRQNPPSTPKPKDESDEPSWMRGPLAEYLKPVEDEEKEQAMMLTEAPEQYERLVMWLREWVPIQMMPGPRSLAAWTRNVEWLRNGGRPVQEAEDAIRETEKEDTIRETETEKEEGKRVT